MGRIVRVFDQSGEKSVEVDAYTGEIVTSAEKVPEPFRKIGLFDPKTLSPTVFNYELDNVGYWLKSYYVAAKE
jgi:hypothetical protein